MPGGQNLNFAVAVEHAMEIIKNPKNLKVIIQETLLKKKNMIVLEQKTSIKMEESIPVMLTTTTMV